MNKTLDEDEKARYARHIMLDEIGVEGQEKLKNASVLCIGSGGLGSPLLMYLAAAGVGKIGLVDFDLVDASNLQRQIIHSTKSIGRPKVDSAVERLKDINPNIETVKFNATFNADNALEIAKDYDVIVDGTDNFPTRYLVNDVCEILGKPNVYGSVFKFEGQASVFNYQNGPTYRDLYPDPPPPGLVPSCAEGGVLGVLPGLIGMIQATETIKIILGLGTSLSGRLLLYDAAKMQFRELAFTKRPDWTPVTELIDYASFCGIDNSPAPFEAMSVETLIEKRNQGWSPFVLDVRRAQESAIIQLEDTDLQHPHTTILEIVDALPRDQEILVYCRSGARSATACRELYRAGFEKVINLEGGMLEWEKAISIT